MVVSNYSSTAFEIALAKNNVANDRAPNSYERCTRLS